MTLKDDVAAHCDLIPLTVDNLDEAVAAPERLRHHEYPMNRYSLVTRHGDRIVTTDSDGEVYSSAPSYFSWFALTPKVIVDYAIDRGDDIYGWYRAFSSVTALSGLMIRRTRIAGQPTKYEIVGPGEEK